MADRIATLWREAYEMGATLELIREILNLDPGEAVSRRHGCTLLHLAANQRVHEGIALLLTLGVEVNAADESGETPLHITAWNLDHEGCRQLLEAGADPVIRDRLGRTSFDIAVNGTRQASTENWEATQRILATAEARVLSRSAGVVPSTPPTPAE